jgi:predicted CopG family antitoxin
MTRIAITLEAYQALVATLPLGSVAYEPEPNAKGERVIWLEEVWLSKLNAMRKPGESYSDVILRLVELGG